MLETAEWNGLFADTDVINPFEHPTCVMVEGILVGDIIRSIGSGKDLPITNGVVVGGSSHQSYPAGVLTHTFPREGLSVALVLTGPCAGLLAESQADPATGPWEVRRGLQEVAQDFNPARINKSVDALVSQPDEHGQLHALVSRATKDFPGAMVGFLQAAGVEFDAPTFLANNRQFAQEFWDFFN